MAVVSYDAIRFLCVAFRELYGSVPNKKPAVAQEKEKIALLYAKELF